MLKYIKTKDITYGGKLFKGRKIYGTEETLALIYPLIDKAIFVWGWRSKEQQAEFVKKGTSKTMDSNHCRGVAYDIWNWQDCEKDMKKIGFINDLKPCDPGHFTLGGEDKARKNNKIISSLPKNIKEYKPEETKKVTKTSTPKVEAITNTITQEIAQDIKKIEEQVQVPIEQVKPQQEPILEQSAPIEQPKPDLSDIGPLLIPEYTANDAIIELVRWIFSPLVKLISKFLK